MNRAAIDRREYPPSRIMDVARLQHGGQALGIGHGGEVAVVCGADPTRARGVGAKLACRIAAGYRVGCAFCQAVLESLAFAREAFPVEGGIVVRACARAMRGKHRLVALDEGHAVGRGIATGLAVFAARERLDGGRNRCETKSIASRSRSPSTANAGCTSKPSRPPGQGVSGPASPGLP